mmetsp:Transcript_40395/g.73071  ORF Transcript_40395/g.73071 Transcript_40395/m.73071 type:complete len:144 (-) Transcript_40395:41-472(-)
MEEAKRRKLAGSEEENGNIYTCSKYVWWNRRQGTRVDKDRNMPTKRMALLYIAKKNSDSLVKHASEIGKAWPELCKGRYAPTPNCPFDLSKFMELSDDELETYSNDLKNVFNALKVPEGESYSCQPMRLELMSVEELSKELES